MIKKNAPSNVSIAIQKTMHSYETNTALIEKEKTNEFTIKIANTLEEREETFKLAYQVYLEKGYVNQNANEWLVQSYDTNKDTVILIVQDKQKNIVGSVTLVFDGTSKLPAERIYREELKTLRANGNKMVEISRLVISPNYRNSKDILVLLFNYLCIYIHHVKAYDHLIIEVNPRHKNYYKTLLNFDEIGCERPCPQVQNAPAVLLQLMTSTYQAEISKYNNPESIVKKERSLYPYFIKSKQESLVAHYLQKQVKPMSAEERIYFGFSESGISRAVCV
jgi:hypothetical protein